MMKLNYRTRNYRVRTERLARERAHASFEAKGYEDDTHLRHKPYQSDMKIHH
jgi:hypothetical protein